MKEQDIMREVAESENLPLLRVATFVHDIHVVAVNNDKAAATVNKVGLVRRSTRSDGHEIAIA